MYFDHVRCPSCGAQFDPESIDSSAGFAACPACQGQLDVKSLFGVAAQFEGVDGPSAGIDDLVAGYGKSDDNWRQTSAVDPLNPGAAGQSGQRHARAPRPTKGGRSTSMVPRAIDPDDDSPTSSVLRALRDIKKGR